MIKEAKMKMAEFVPLQVCLFSLTLKVPITTAADDIYKYFYIVYQRK